MDEKQTYLASKEAKYALGTHRGPLPTEGLEIEHVETANSISLEPVKRTRSQTLRRHWARFWCCYAFWGIIFLAIFLPIFFCVIIPAIAQRVLDNGTLVLVHADVLQPRPNSIMLSINSALNLPISFPVRMDNLTLSLFNRFLPENNTWAKLYMDGATISGNTTLTVDDQFTPLDVYQWTQYVRSVVFEAHAPLSVKAPVTAYIGKLKSHITLNKDIKQNTLSSFAGFSISDPKLLLPAESDGTNLVANATLPNPSVMTLEIGNTTLNLLSGNLTLGNCTLNNLMLRPGNHSTPVRGILDLGTLIENIGPILSEQSDSIKEGYLSLTAVGANVEYEGVQVPYYTEVMKNLTMTAKVPLGSLVTNTLSGILHPNGTNIFAGLNMTTDSGETFTVGEDKADGGSDGASLGRRALKMLGQEERRDEVVDVLKALMKRGAYEI
ncbi:hypothetical protein AnigIFM63604_009571 [Aspergillus niger]|uniref:Uncharacterized protein n=1 Tax=Aspergillus niger TaxID=5061 RepID=A0A9W6A6M5_ASPNG|nr:hypothetical protein CBS133816_3022 [Aspergillus niger]KAI2839321.1 hypothetical protein CBS11350_7576 [Aspergillus niger]KAI2915851.1 hypothetical protein CBS147371_5557 [Aspergillus niger]KAI2924370.1 hypothetical protein CBS147320_6664 [Aspergillus niger]KAI2937098.1 hypothetical protein CBS147321_8067 [Aspergillus niger]